MCQICTETWQGKDRDKIMFSPCEVEQSRNDTACLFSRQFWQLTDHLQELLSWDENKCMTAALDLVVAAILQCDTPA